MRPRAFGLVALLCALISAACWVAHVAEVRTMDEAARRIRGDRPLTSEQLFVRFCDYAFREIRNPTYRQLPFAVRMYYLLNPTHPGPSDVLRWGSDYRGGCGSHTRVVVALLRASGVEARQLFLTDDDGHSIHTVVNAKIDGRWVVADTYNGIVFRTRDGRLATSEDLAADTANFHRQTRALAWYDPQYDYDHVAIMNWQKVPVLLPALHALLTAFLGPERVAEIGRPVVWMWPRAVWSLAWMFAAVAFGTLAWLGMRAPASAREPARAREPGAEAAG